MRYTLPAESQVLEIREIFEFFSDKHNDPHEFRRAVFQLVCFFQKHPVRTIKIPTYCLIAQHMLCNLNTAMFWAKAFKQTFDDVDERRSFVRRLASANQPDLRSLLKVFIYVPRTVQVGASTAIKELKLISPRWYEPTGRTVEKPTTQEEILAKLAA